MGAKMDTCQTAREAIERAGDRPCIFCHRPAVAAVQWQPPKPERFGIGPEGALYFGCCRACLDKELDENLLEKMALADFGLPVL